MISSQILEALDLSLWLGCGRHAAALLQCDQSTISRYCQAACRTFRLASLKEARIQLDSPSASLPAWSRLLAQERCIHQLARVLESGKLRVHSNRIRIPARALSHWQSNSAFACDLPRVQIERLLQASILDAAVLDSAVLDEADLSGIPGTGGPELIRIPLISRSQLVVNPAVAENQLALRCLQSALLDPALPSGPPVQPQGVMEVIRRGRVNAG